MYGFIQVKASVKCKKSGHRQLLKKLHFQIGQKCGSMSQLAIRNLWEWNILVD